MKVIPFNIPKSGKEFVRFQEDSQPFFYDRLHRHPEMQLSCILEGEGKLMVGDYIGTFRPGDIFLLGPDLPHVFRSSDDYYEKGAQLSSRAIMLFIDFKTLGPGLEELEEVKLFFENLNGCYKVVPNDTPQFLMVVKSLEGKTKLDKLMAALKVVQMLMDATDLKRLNLADRMLDLSEREGKRMEKVMRFLVEEYNRPVSLKEIASVANMSKEAFCRFFKVRTRKTFVNYLNELRIDHACQMLLQSDRAIVDIAFASGFQNLSNFNRNFIKQKGITPTVYRKEVQNKF